MCNCCGRVSCRRVKCCLGISSTGNENLVLNQQGDWISPASALLFFENGLTENTGTVKLGGEIIENTSLEFDPTVYGITFGDLNIGKGVIVGNALSSNEFLFIVGNADSASITAKAITLETTDGGDVNVNSNNSVAIEANDGVSDHRGLMVLEPYATTPAAGLSLQKSQDFEVGVFAIDSPSKKYANIYYGVLDVNNVITDISRFEANENEVHGRKYITPGGNYNGIHCNTTYSQLEFNKTAEDGQASGTVWVLDADGASMYVGGARQFRIKNSVPSYADDAAALSGGLITGDVYKTTTGGSTFLKIVP